MFNLSEYIPIVAASAQAQWLFVGSAFAFGLGEVILSVTKYQTRDKEMDAGSLRLIWISMLVGFALALLCPAFPKLAIVLPGDTILYWGTGLIVSGILLRWLAIQTLGQWFSVNVVVSQSQPIITHGVFRWIRHPAYSGMLMTVLGISFASGNLLKLLVFVIPIYYAIFARMYHEEALLLTTLGDQYAVYVKKTKRFIPFIY